ncbi:Aldo/keto reductase family-domain-containing protein [Lanmaoa asiatica]|nr:Aldo/keto reductase family-domain-containing protein [Lanmaoa asiatica]
MGGNAPPQSLHTLSRHSHGRSRSRSRNNSISLSFSAPSLSPSAPPSPPLHANVSLNPPSKRPTSHHQRRSSVSTRRESAELMGVSLPELPTANSDDNINLGDKDSVRRRALWALEGKPDLAFSKVEIPDISSPDITKQSDFPTKPSFPPGSGISGFAAKRDSFGKMFGSTSASKDQLGTLIEEEEEEEEESQFLADPTEEHKESPRVIVGLPAKTTSRHRPASLNLRPLSLVQGSFVNPVVGNLPTPTLTPGTHPNTRQPFITATLDSAVSSNVNVPPGNTSISVRQTPASRRFSFTLSGNTPTLCDHDKKRCSSISYKRSTESIPRDMFSLPTPEMTPTERRFSFASDQETLIEQPLSVADQHFLFRSHHVLLSRITELERTLRHRASLSRHVSYASDTSTMSSEPSDEMLRLVSDLKAERDELKRDVDGWRQRVADADKQAGMLAKRIESERREAWVARSRLGLLEVEKSGLEKSLELKAAALSQSMTENAVLVRERHGMKDEIMKLNTRLKDADAAVSECTRLRGALEQERTRRKELEKILDDAGLLSTPKLPHAVNGSWRRSAFPAKPVGTRPRGLGFQSIDSESSTTDVESADDSFTKAEFTLDAVAEEEVEFSDEENGLAGYEDEDDSDLSFSSPGGSSIGSADELDFRSKIPATEILDRPARPSLPIQLTHQSRASLSKTWTFPRGKTVAPVKQDDDEVDRFFGCLDDVDRSPPRSEEMNQSTFSSAFRSMSDDDELPPFVLPSDVGVVVESVSSGKFDVIPEEEAEAGIADIEDDELVGEEVEGGIRFTFNAPPIICVTPPPDICITPPPEIRITPLEGCMTTPAVRPVSSKPNFIPERVEDDEDETSLTFVFPSKFQPRRVDGVTSPPRSSPPTSRSGFCPSSRNDSPPSSIPRSISLRSMSPKTPSIMFTPSKNVSGRFIAPSAYSTPSSKKTSSSIPQPVTSPKFYSTPTKAQTLVISKQSQSSTPNGSTFKPHSKLFMNAPALRKVAAPRRRHFVIIFYYVQSACGTITLPETIKFHLVLVDASKGARQFMRNWYAVEVWLGLLFVWFQIPLISSSLQAIPLYAVIGLAVGGASWYLTRLARGPSVVWTRGNPTPWNDVKPDENTKMLDPSGKFSKRPKIMVERLDAPQPTFPLPPLADIPDEHIDKADDAKRITTYYGPADIVFPTVPALVFGAASFSAFYNDDDHIRSVTPLRTTRLALRYGIRAFDTSPYYGPSEIVLGNALKVLENEFPRSSYQIFTKCGRFGNTRDAFDYTPQGVRASVQRSLARLHTTYLDIVYVHDVEFIAESKTPRTSGDHRAALGAEADAYGLQEGREAVVYGDGDREVLAAIGELRRQQDAGVVRRVGISGASPFLLLPRPTLGIEKLLGYPLPTLLRLAILVKHTAPYKPLDVVMSYCHLNIQNRTLLEFKAAFERRAGVKQVITASPLSMRLLTPNPTAWHPASENLKEAVKRAVRVSDGESGLPELALEYAFHKAREVEIPTVVGLGSLKDVHENARIWYHVDKQGLGENEEWKQRIQDVLSVFGEGEGGLLDRSWENPGFRS